MKRDLPLILLATTLAGCGEKSVTSVSPLNDPVAQSVREEPPRPAVKEATAPLPPEDPTPVTADPTTLDSAGLQAAGLKALQAGEIDAAYDYARQAMRLSSDDPQVIFLMAMVLGQRQRFPEAIEMLDQVAETTPDARLPAMGQTADWLVRYGRWAEAESRYQQLLRQLPESAMVHRQLASLLRRQGRNVEASSHLNQLCYLGDVTENELRSMLSISHPFVGVTKSGSFEPIGELGLARTEVARDDWEAVRQRLQPLASPGPWESALLARSFAMLEDLPKLNDWITEADKSVDVSPDAWFARGVYAARMDQPTPAIRCFAEAVLIDPTDADAYDRLARSLAETGSTEQADAVRQRADLIRQTQRIGMRMSQSDDRDLQDLLLLSDQLKQLQRPLESLGWRGVWLSYAVESAPVSEREAQSVLDEIAGERTSLIAADATTADLEDLLCGVDLEQLPPRNRVVELLKTLPFDASP